MVTSCQAWNTKAAHDVSDMPSPSRYQQGPWPKAGNPTANPRTTDKPNQAWAANCSRELQTTSRSARSIGCCLRVRHCCCEMGKPPRYLLSSRNGGAAGRTGNSHATRLRILAMLQMPRWAHHEANIEKVRSIFTKGQTAQREGSAASSTPRVLAGFLHGVRLKGLWLVVTCDRNP